MSHMSAAYPASRRRHRIHKLGVAPMPSDGELRDFPATDQAIRAARPVAAPGRGRPFPHETTALRRGVTTGGGDG